MAGRGTGPDFVEALARGLDVLSCFDERRPRMTLSEIAAATGLARPTARRALADEELAPGIRSVAVPVRDGDGVVRAAMNVTVHAAEISVDVLVGEHLPHLLRTAGQVSADWALWQSAPRAEVAAERATGTGPG